VRIAISGSHRVGKSTLLDALAAALTGYDCVDEPYHLLEDDGHVFADPPGVDDFVAQLSRSIEELAASGPDTLFDRCPADLLAYLVALGVDITPVLGRAAAAMSALDLLVVVPIESPDRVQLAYGEDAALRNDVDAALAELLDDDVAPGVDVLVVHGDLAERVSLVLRRLGQ
jgi:predicted ATPase